MRVIWYQDELQRLLQQRFHWLIAADATNQTPQGDAQNLSWLDALVSRLRLATLQGQGSFGTRSVPYLFSGGWRSCSKRIKNNACYGNAKPIGASLQTLKGFAWESLGRARGAEGSVGKTRGYDRRERRHAELAYAKA